MSKAVCVWTRISSAGVVLWQENHKAKMVRNETVQLLQQQSPKVTFADECMSVLVPRVRQVVTSLYRIHPFLSLLDFFLLQATEVSV